MGPNSGDGALMRDRKGRGHREGGDLPPTPPQPSEALLDEVLGARGHSGVRARLEGRTLALSIGKGRVAKRDLAYPRAHSPT